MLIELSDPTPDDPTTTRKFWLRIAIKSPWSDDPPIGRMIRPNSTFCHGTVPDDPDLVISGEIFVYKKRIGSDDPILGRIIQT